MKPKESRGIPRNLPRDKRQLTFRHIARVLEVCQFGFGNLQPIDLRRLVRRVFRYILKYEHGRFGTVQDLLLLLVQIVVEQIVVDVDLLLLFEVF